MANTRLSKLTPLEIPLFLFTFNLTFSGLLSFCFLRFAKARPLLVPTVAFNETIIVVNTCAYKVSHIVKHMFEIPMCSTI